MSMTQYGGGLYLWCETDVNMVHTSESRVLVLKYIGKDGK